MTTTELLAIDKPEDLFPGDPREARKLFLELSRQHHPDHGGTNDAFAHLNTLYKEALAKFKAGRWNGAQLVYLRMTRRTDGHQVHARAGAPFQFGHSLLADDAVYYLFDRDQQVRQARVVGITREFKFASKRMQDEFARYLPMKVTGGELVSGQWLARVEKTPDLIRLRDLHTHLGPLDPRKCAWVVSAMMNLACYLAHTGLVHHDISPDTVFVSPPHHSVALLGGWEHAVRRGVTIHTVPARTFAVMPYRAKMRKIASTRTDLELIRLTARDVLATAPEPMRTWLHAVSHATAVDQYKEWQDVLSKTFGPRKFIAMLTGPDDVYRHEQKKGKVS